jgi:hypothetical protein
MSLEKHRVCVNCRADIQLIKRNMDHVPFPICSIVSSGRMTAPSLRNGSPICTPPPTQQQVAPAEVRVRTLPRALLPLRQQVRRGNGDHRQGCNQGTDGLQRLQLLHEGILLYGAVGSGGPAFDETEHRQRALWRGCQVIKGRLLPGHERNRRIPPVLRH